MHFLMITLPLLAQFEGGPESPSPLTEGAERIFTVGAEVAEDVAAGFTPLWINVMEGGLYQAIAGVGTLVAVAALGLFLVQWAHQMMNGEGDKAFTELIWPVIVIVFLSNDGALLSTATLELRAIGNQINTSVLESAVANESLQQEYQQTRFGSAIDDVLAASVAECVENSQGRAARQRSACLSAAYAEANRVRRQYGLIPAEEASWLGSALQWLLRNFLWALHYAFQWAVEIVLLIIALLGPLAMGLSLLPTPSKPLIGWISGLSGIFLIKLTFNLISGLSAYAISLQSISTTSLVLPVLLGLLAPILSVLVGLQGGGAFFNALSTASVYIGYRKAAGLGKGAAQGGYKLGRAAVRSLRR